MTKIYLGFLIMILCTVAANLLMKLGALQVLEARWFGMISTYTVMGIAVFGVAGILYAWLLHYVPLHLAQIFASAQFFAVIVAAWLVLGESVSPIRWLGILLIVSGIILVGFNSNSEFIDKTNVIN